MLEHSNKVHLMGVLSASLGLTRYLETLLGGAAGAERRREDRGRNPCMSHLELPSCVPG